MPKLPRTSGVAIVKVPERLGFAKIRQSGSHVIRKKPLIETNPSMKDIDRYRRGLIKNVYSSTAIETSANVGTIAKTLATEPSLSNVKGGPRSPR